MTTYVASTGFARQNGRQEILDGILLPGENVLYVAAVSPFVYWKAAAIAFMALIVLFFSIQLCLFFLLVAIISFLVAYSARRYLLLAATDRRIVIRGGIMNTSVIQLTYDAVESLAVSSMLLGQMFGYGTVIIAGRGQQRILMPYIENAMALETLVTQRAQKEVIVVA